MLIRKAYDRLEEAPYIYEETKEIIHYYFWKYEKATGRPHPNITVDKLVVIIDCMACISNEYENVDFEPENYQALIDQHFKTRYQKGCDYSISHFFSGDIRLLRYYEVLY